MPTTPRTQRRGWLRNGNPPGDFLKAQRCGAKTRRGTACQGPAMRNGCCRMHGGLSTRPKTPEGIERIRRAQLKHGRYTKAAKAERAGPARCDRGARCARALGEGGPLFR